MDDVVMLMKRAESHPRTRSVKVSHVGVVSSVVGKRTAEFESTTSARVIRTGHRTEFLVVILGTVGDSVTECKEMSTSCGSSTTVKSWTCKVTV